MTCVCIIGSAQVPCKDVILHARASSSAGASIKELAKVPLCHSEQGVHKVLGDHGCKLDVPLQYVDLPTQKHVPYVKMQDWVRYLARSNKLHFLVGTNDRAERREICLEFWRRFQLVRPHHPIFMWAQQDKLDLGSTFPVLHHGDEGRTYRRHPIMLLSTHGLLGTGCRRAEDGNKARYRIQEDPMRLNFRGSTLTNHYIFCALPHQLYKKCPEALDTMLSLYAKDMEELMTQGVEVVSNHKRERIFLACVAAKGDLPYLGRSGGFTRSFSKCAKQATSKKFSGGICWMCLAGVEGRSEAYPWERLSTKAAWLKTYKTEPGYNLHGPLLQIPTDSGEEFYRPDFWHCFHLGCGKSFIASAVVCLLERMDPDTSYPQKLDWMTKDFKAFCKRRHCYGYIGSITRDLLGWEKTTDCPHGTWHKGHVTTRFFEWLEDLLAREWDNPSDPYIQEIAPVIKQQPVSFYPFVFPF